MGVSGFLISWAMRLATSRHAAIRWAFSSSVKSSNTATIPMNRSCSSWSTDTFMKSDVGAPATFTRAERSR